MKKLFTLITLFISCFLYSQNYHYSSYSNYLDYIGHDNILKNKISKIEIRIEDFQIITIHFNEKAQIKKIETMDSSLNKIISETIFTWNSNFNYLLSSLSNYSSEDFTFMTKSDYSYIRKGDKKMSPVDVTQYWIKNTLFWYAEKYNLHNYINTITRSLDGAVDYSYFENKLLKSMKIRKVSSDEFSNERTIIYPKHHIQENKTVEFEYDNFKNIKNTKNYFRGGLTQVQDFKYHNNLLSNINEKTNYNNSNTEISYSNNLVIKTSLTSDLYPDPFISTIVYYIGDEKINLTEVSETKNLKPQIIQNSENEDTIRIRKKLHQLCVNQIPFFSIDSDEFECFYELSMNYLKKYPNISLENLVENNLMDFYKKCYNATNLKNSEQNKTKPNYSLFSTKVNLNLRSKPSINSDALIMIPKDTQIIGDEAKNTNNQNTFDINGVAVTSNWIYTEYDSIKGWVFKGGLEKIK